MRFTSLARAAVGSASSSSASSSSSSALPRNARIAIIGAGPSGFYAASRLLSRIPYSDTDSPAHQPLRIDIFDRLPVPHGLVRYGVAPDHPDVKNVENKFATVSQDPRLRFAGNVNVVHSASPATAGVPYPGAVQLPLEVLSRYYTHVLFSYGASTGRSLGIPGSGPGELSGVYSALEFVNWYNGHPAAHDATLLANSPFGIDLHDKQHLTVIGAGNVALDVARIVLRSSTPFLDPSGEARVSTSNQAPGLAALEATDVPEPVLAELARCKVRHVDVFARRGPAQLAFTNKEVREMLSLKGIALSTPDKGMLDAALAQLDTLAKSGASDAARAQEISSEVRVKKRLLSLLAKGSSTKPQAEAEIKSWALNFFRSPARFLPKQNAPKNVGGVEWNVTALASGQPTPANLDAADPKKAAWSAGSSDPTGPTPTATGQTATTATDMVVASVGYQSEPLFTPSTSTPASASTPARVQEGLLAELPFDAVRKTVPNVQGRVVDPQTDRVIPGIYVSGWLARGPTGVIATTMMDAYAVADSILADLHTPGDSAEAEEANLLDHLRQHETRRVVGFDGWRRIDEEERRRGAKLGKLREKVLSIDEMLTIVG